MGLKKKKEYLNEKKNWENLDFLLSMSISQCVPVKKQHFLPNSRVENDLAFWYEVCQIWQSQELPFAKS